MNTLILAFISLAVFGLLLFIDSKVKGNFSILIKVLSLLFVGVLIGGLVLFYGQAIFETIQVDFKSFTNLRNFFSSKILGAIAIVLIYLFVFLKMFFIVFKFITKQTFEREEKAVDLVSIVFDIAVVPCIVLASGASLVLVVPAIISLLLTGLALTKKLVFCFSYNKNKEVLA
ncbi:MAG: hypothetical protein KBS97_02235 [Firmicutes bacterium]|nr:hypothetical protein [Candidatus Fiminaster equi]